MRSKASKGIAVLCAALLGMSAFASSAFAISEVYWDGLMAPGYVTSYNHTLTNAGSRTISGESICVQSYHASDGSRAGPVSCNSGAGQIASVNYPCACTLMHAATASSQFVNVRARIDF